MAYNGWSNYETWCVHLWLSNDEGLYLEAREVVRGQKDEWYAGKAIRSLVEEMTPDLGASMFSDLLTSALQEVDWQEVAAAFKDEDEDEDDEDAIDPDEEDEEDKETLQCDDEQESEDKDR